MRLSLIYADDQITVNCEAETEAEKQILGALACGPDHEISVSVNALTKKHWTYGDVEYARIVLSRADKHRDPEAA